MKHVESEFICKRCGVGIRFKCEKPTVLDVTHKVVFCDQCNTEYSMQVKMKPGSDGKGLDVEMKYVLPKPEVAVAPI